LELYEFWETGSNEVGENFTSPYINGKRKGKVFSVLLAKHLDIKAYWEVEV
jgi:hypothetical protein